MSATLAGKLKPSYSVAMAAGMDAGNRNARQAGRVKWTRADWNVASATALRLISLNDGGILSADAKGGNK